MCVRFHALLCLFATSAVAFFQPAAAQPGMDEAAAFENDIMLSEKLGQALYERDTAAYVAAGALQDRFAPDELGWLSGWLTVKEGDEYKVVFVGDQGTEPRAYYYVFLAGDTVGVIDSFAPAGGAALTERERAQWRARQGALAQDFERCAQEYNPVIIPYSGREGGEGGLFVYLMPATADGSRIVAGGYELFDYSDDGRTVKGTMQFARNCLDIEKSGNEKDNLILSHSLTPYPQEHHVFMSLLHGTDVFVVTEENKLVWKISNGDIEFVQRQGVVQ